MLQIPEVLDAEQLASVRRVLEDAEFVDGRLTAGEAASQVKQNEELARDASVRDKLAQAVMAALHQQPAFEYGVLPYRASTPIVARYGSGMTYGDHVDDPVMGAGPQRYRSDVSVTLFLSGPEEYEGGELVIHTSYGTNEVKLPAGYAVAYPSSSLHRVTEVTRGQRLVALTWVQSMVRDPARRELLWNLYQARQHLLDEAPEAEAAKRVDVSYVNLLRMWSEV